MIDGEEEISKLSNLQQQNQRKAIIEQDKLNKRTSFDPQEQLYPADLFILVGFNSKGQPIQERNPRWHTPDGFYNGKQEDLNIRKHFQRTPGTRGL